ncbi:hypothetical protein A8E25_00365 [Burkholderia cenocepacia]|nr:hypothetical protein BURCENK562V_C3388 [Burkholderia cenocepacia K56-2Valvano]ERI28469.1 hypothetical protein BURCENBC7_AP2906 [Burkholderia cenocepacia BC7]ONR65432.1 hypothetical protein A8E17_05465 [Burkholderia cenocepacia]ONR74002.1 hypothetical protein A8E23_10395 [Burkholderia cenocepacia]ONR75053.1 hypothetical protein A8E18_09735 [Burkholderia cenocepacia]
MSARNDYAAEILPNPNFNVYPTDNEFTFAFPKTVKGVTIGNIGYNTIRFRNISDAPRRYSFPPRVRTT